MAYPPPFSSLLLLRLRARVCLFSWALQLVSWSGIIDVCPLGEIISRSELFAYASEFGLLP